MAEHTLIADGFVVGRDATGEEMRVKFTGGPDTVNIIMPISIGPALARDIEHMSGHLRPRPTMADELSVGEIVHPIGREVRRKADGSTLLTLILRADDGARSIPIALSPDEAAELAGSLLAR